MVENDASNFFDNIRIMFLFSFQESRGLIDLLDTRNSFSEDY